MFVIFILVVAFQVVSCQHSMDPRITIHETVPASDENGIVRGTIAKDVTLNCFIENKPAEMDVRWQRIVYEEVGDETIVRTLPISRDMASEDVNKWSIEKPTDFSWRLRIKAIQVDDEGTYRCFIRLNIDTIVSKERHMIVTDPPLIIEGGTDSDKTVRAGDYVELRCSASGRPEPTMIWRREGNAVLPDGGVIRYTEKLEISNIQAHHRGRYFCEAYNNVGSAQRDITLSVQYAPIVRSDERNVMQALGYKRTLICYVDANPQPSSDPGTMQLSWTKNRQTVVYDDRVYTRVLQGARGMLTYELVFSRVESGDFGTYMCRARNSLGGPMESLVTIEESNEPQRDKGFISGAKTNYSSLFWVVICLCVYRLYV